MVIMNTQLRLSPALRTLSLLALSATAGALSLMSSFAFAEGVEPAAAEAAPAPNASAKPALECEHYKIYYIDMGTKFVAPPVPIEQHAQKVFCSKSPHIDRLFKALELSKPIKKRSDLGRGRIKIVPAKASDFEAALILDNGEVVRRMNTYLAPKKIVRGAVTALKEEAEKAP